MVVRKLPVLLALVSVAGLATAPGAVALGLASRQVARAPHRVAHRALPSRPPRRAPHRVAHRALPGRPPHRAAHRVAHRAAHRVPLRGHRPRGLAAASDACPGASAPGAPVAAQREAMRCLVDFARRAAGLPALADSPALDRSADAKSADVLRCDEFSHFACGREFTYWMRATGYLPAPCWRVGENLALWTGPETSAREIFGLWMHSPEHRRNILGDYTQLGVGLRIGDFGRSHDAYVWTQHFGSHCGSRG